MQNLPFAGIAEELVALMKIARTERLQRVLLRHGTQQIAIFVEQSPTAGEVIAQLANQHGGRSFTVVADAAPHPADVQLIARRQKRLKQKITVIFTS
ncbi:hypothetical protein D3C78_1484290 [compost metagenome]